MIKIFAYSYGHPKNKNAILKYKNIKFVNNIDEADIIYDPGYPREMVYVNKLYMFGPHFSNFPERKIEFLVNNKQTNWFYIQPSNWIREIWVNKLNALSTKINIVPFGVDTYKFTDSKSINNKNKVMVYTKLRKPDEVKSITDFLEKNKINYYLIDYIKGYSEDDFINLLQDTKYSIIVDAHESQGFAVLEILSCNVPCLVWNVTSLNQEYNSGYEDLYATTIPYWDSQCGEYFYDFKDFEETYYKFINNIKNYTPRKFILENLSMDICEQILIDAINKNLKLLKEKQFIYNHKKNNNLLFL